MIFNRPYVAVLITIGMLLGACAGNNNENKVQADKSEATPMDHTAHKNMDMGSGGATEQSIYNVSSQWKNRYARPVGLDSLKGKVQVVAMVYTHCEYACPRILADMKRIGDRLSKEELEATNFVIVSIDPERDTPKRLRTFATENELDDDHWTLLNGNEGDVLELAALLGVKYKRVSEQDFTHSNMITVLNKQGEIMHQQKKLGDQPTATVDAIKRLTL